MDDYGGIDEAFELFFKLLRTNRVYGRVILSAGRPRKKEKYWTSFICLSNCNKHNS